eukprot:jgi/Tetstr1/438407/TSEL_026973.t1
MAAEANALEVEAAVESSNETDQPLLEAHEMADRDESHEDSRESVNLKATVYGIAACSDGAAEADAEAEAEAERAADAECAANTARVLAFAKLVATTV